MAIERDALEKPGAQISRGPHVRREEATMPLGVRSMRQAALEHPCCERAPNCWSGVAQTARDDCESVTVVSVVASVTMAKRPGDTVLRPYSCCERPKHVDHAT